MRPSSISPPSSRREGGEAGKSPGGLFSDCLLLDFLYPVMFFMPLQTHILPLHSVLTLPPIPLPVPLCRPYPPQCLCVPDIKDAVFQDLSVSNVRRPCDPKFLVASKRPLKASSHPPLIGFYTGLQNTALAFKQIQQKC